MLTSRPSLDMRAPLATPAPPGVKASPASHRVALGEALEGDSPRVFRDVVSVDALEKMDARLLGKLSPPPPGALPPGVELRTDASGLRVLSLNVHWGVAGDMKLSPANESIQVLRDDARFVNSLNPDIVLVQEVQNRKVGDVRGGLPEQASILAHLFGASDMAFTPAIQGDPATGPHAAYGTAGYARNGYTFDRVMNVELPALGADIETRSAGVAVAVPPEGSPASETPATVMWTHLPHRRAEDQSLRDSHLKTLAGVADGIREDGGFTFRSPLDPRQFRAEGYPRHAVVIGGDFNQTQAPSDAAFNPSGLQHVFELGDAGPARSRVTAADVPTCEERRIDQLYQRGFTVTDVATAAVPSRESVGPPTDHWGVLADLKR